MKASVPTPDNGAGRSPANGRIFGLKKSTLSLITALAVGTPLLVACDSTDAIPVNTEVTSTPAATTTEQTPAPTTTSKAPVVESTTSKEKSPENEGNSTTPDTTEPSEDIPEEHINALEFARLQVEDNPTWSKQLLYNALASKAGGKFSEDSTEYALDNLGINWDNQALLAVRTTLSDNDFSQPTLFDHLTKQLGFTERESSDALERANINWNEQATRKAQTYIDKGGTSKRFVSGWLTYDDRFTESQAEYALENADVDWNEQATIKAQYYIDLGGIPRELAYIGLTEEEQFTVEEAEYALNHADVDWNVQAKIYADRIIRQFDRSYYSTYHTVLNHGFSESQAQFGVDNADVDWNAFALRKAQSRVDNGTLSAFELLEELHGKVGYNTAGWFTDEQAQYAMNNLVVDWNHEALEKQDDYLRISPILSRPEMNRQLRSHGYTPSEVEWAIENAPADTWKNQASRFARRYMLSDAPTRDDLISKLLREDYTRDEAEYAADKVGL